ncbi:hypothetical protein E5845_13830 [Pseudomonas fluorescens]|nr:hypothetical protein E5845_13830 [Pseudomonas fluorescens]
MAEPASWLGSVCRWILHLRRGKNRRPFGWYRRLFTVAAGISIGDLLVNLSEASANALSSDCSAAGQAIATSR